MLQTADYAPVNALTAGMLGARRSTGSGRDPQALGPPAAASPGKVFGGMVDFSDVSVGHFGFLEGWPV